MYTLLNKNVFNFDLKMLIESEFLMCCGREFHSGGTTAAKARLP